MTCTEWRRMSKEVDPLTATVAEVAAYFVHSAGCQECRAWRKPQEGPPARTPNAEIRLAVLKCMADPEARAMLTDTVLESLEAAE